MSSFKSLNGVSGTETDASSAKKPSWLLWGAFLLVLAVALNFTFLRHLTLFAYSIPLLVFGAKFVNLQSLWPQISLQRRHTFIKGRTIIPLSCADVVKKVAAFSKGSQADHFDQMLKQISWVTQINDNLVMTEETYEAKVWNLFGGESQQQMSSKTTTVWIQEDQEGVRKTISLSNVEQCITYVLKNSLDHNLIKESIVFVPLEDRNHCLVYLFSQFHFSVKNIINPSSLVVYLTDYFLPSLSSYAKD